MFCVNCGEKLNEGEMVCHKCGVSQVPITGEGPVGNQINNEVVQPVNQMMNDPMMMQQRQQNMMQQMMMQQMQQNMAQQNMMNQAMAQAAFNQQQQQQQNNMNAFQAQTPQIENPNNISVSFKLQIKEGPPKPLISIQCNLNDKVSLFLALNSKSL